MTNGGLFITLYDEATLQLYLARGVYGQHMAPTYDKPPSHSAFYRTLADYAAARRGTHVFFFLKRKLYYGGQIVGSDKYGAFCINGQTSLMGKKHDVPLVWDESGREAYTPTGAPGVFDAGQSRGVKSQPFLIQFEDRLDLVGRYIISDQLYFELGEFAYPLPANTIAGMGFCTLTPGETSVIMRQLRNNSAGAVEAVSPESVYLQGEPVPFSPAMGVATVEEAHPESHLEASIIANPGLLPEHLHPNGAVMCRQVPISPLKPKGMDKADVCYFTDDLIRDGTIPNVILELKIRTAGKAAAKQVTRYMKWLHDRLGTEAYQIRIFVYAPSFTSTFWDYVPNKYTSQVIAERFSS